jgi:hypothetical protein
MIMGIVQIRVLWDNQSHPLTIRMKGSPLFDPAFQGQLRRHSVLMEGTTRILVMFFVWFVFVILILDDQIISDKNCHPLPILMYFVDELTLLKLTHWPNAYLYSRDCSSFLIEVVLASAVY